MGCQIDMLIQTHFRVLYLVEIKFSKNPIPIACIEEVKAKIRALNLPRGFSVKPILLHVNGVADALEDARFFANIVDFSDLLSTH